MDKNWSSLIKAGKWLVFIVSAAALIGGCSSGGGGETVTPPATVITPAVGTIAGTAATGAPIVGQVVVIDSSVPRQTFAATTSAAGAYTVNVAGGTAPFILTIVGASGGKTVSLNSIATASGQTVNITPLTDLIVSTASGQPGGDVLANLCASTVAADQTSCKSALTTATTGSKLSDAVTAVKQMVAPLDSTGADPLNGVFTANGSGMDAVLDQIMVTPAAAQGAMATVTLIAVPGVQLGTVTMPATAGGTSTAATVTTNPADISAATAAQTALSEIRVCLANFSALYPANMTVAPTSTQVAKFVDVSFSLGAVNQAAFVGMLSTLPTATGGSNGGMAIAGTTMTTSGFSPFDFSQQSSGNLLTTTSAVSTNSAWIGLNWGGSTTNGGFLNMKMIKTADTAGCPGGWKVAGPGHLMMHMQARVSKNSYPTTTYTRLLPFHIQTTESDREAIGKIVVTGPGLSVYSGDMAAPVGAATPITLLAAPAVMPPAVRLSSMYIQGYGASEAIQSCQDLASASGATGTPCYDETAVAPGAMFTYTVYAVDTTTLKYAFPFQINAVPLSRAFILANQQDIFPQNITAVPAGPTALNTAATSISTGANLDGIITLNYTNSSVYGARTNHCGIGVTDATNTVVLRAEQNADGLTTQQTSCTFNTAGLNSGSLAKPSVSFGGISSYMYVSNMTLGNQAGSGVSYQ